LPLVYSQRPDGTHIAGLHASLKLRRYVRKGEKDIVILAPMVGKKKSGDELDEGAQTRLFGFRAAYVFDMSQTEGDPLPEFATVQGDPQKFTERRKGFIAATSLVVSRQCEGSKHAYECDNGCGLLTLSMAATGMPGEVGQSRQSRGE
jgi:hypothetical protein